MYTDWDVHLLLELTGSLDPGRMINMLVAFADAVFSVSCFSHTAEWNQSKHVFLNTVIAPFCCSGQRTRNIKNTWKHPEIRTIWEQFEAEIAEKLRKTQAQPKVTGSYKKKACSKNEPLAPVSHEFIVFVIASLAIGFSQFTFLSRRSYYL